MNNDKTMEDILGRVDKKSSEVLTRMEAMGKENEELKTRLKYVEETMKTSRKEVKDEKKISLSRLFNGLQTGKWDGSEFERDVVQEGVKLSREMGMDAVGTGGALVAPQYLPNEFVDQLRSQIVTAKLGAHVLDGLSGSPVLIPKVSGGTTVYWVGENASKTPSDLTTAQVSMTPYEAACLTKVSNRLMQLSNPSVDRLIADDMGAAIAREIDRVALLGTGGANDPVGLLNIAGIGTYDLINDAGAGAVPTPEDVEGIIYTLEAANGSMGSVGWASHPRFFSALSRLRVGAAAGDTTAGPFAYKDDIKTGMLEGFPIVKSTQIPININKGGALDTSYAFYGNWADLIIGYWGGIQFRVSQEAGDAFQYNQTWVRASVLVDVNVRHEASFVVVDGVRA